MFAIRKIANEILVMKTNGKETQGFPFFTLHTDNSNFQTYEALFSGRWGVRMAEMMRKMQAVRMQNSRKNTSHSSIKAL